MTVTPKWGLPHMVPDDAIAAWGARLIVDQQGMVDLVWDRQGADDGPHADELCDLLDASLIKEMRETIRDLLVGSMYDDEWVQMDTRRAEDFIIHMDDRVIMHANTNGSAGYCYVTAWLRPKRYSGPPHPDYPGMVWSDPSIEGKVLSAIEEADSPAAAVAAIMQILNSVGYDSMDREMAFWIATQIKGWEYDDLYDVWLTGDEDGKASGYQYLAAQQAYRMYGKDYADYIEKDTAEKVAKGYDVGDRSLGEALAGNDGD